MTQPHAPSTEPVTASTPLSLARLALAALVAVAVIATLIDTASRATINPFNFFGYFTIQSNIAIGVVWLIAAIQGLRGDSTGRALSLARGLTTSYILIVGIVYAVLLAPLGAAGGVPLPWANTILHVVTPIAGALDWVLAPDRRPLRWRLLALVLAYPTVWLTVVLIRGATDGWVPYPFLHPDQGYGTIAVVCAGIAVTVLVVGALVFWISQRTVRSQVLRGALGRSAATTS